MERWRRTPDYIALRPAKSDDFPPFYANRLSRSGSVPHIAAMPKPRRIVVLVVPPIEELDLIGPVQVLSTATRLMDGRGTPYDIRVISTTRDRLIAGESGLSIVAQAYYQDLKGEIDSLLVVSGVKGRNRRDDELAAWLRSNVSTCRRVGAVCISAFLLARAGVLTNQRATVHWKYAHELAHRYPGLQVDPNPIWVQAGNIYTSSGFSAGIDLALAWVAEDCGSTIAIEAARELVLFLRRPAGQTQLSVTLSAGGRYAADSGAPGVDRGQPQPAGPVHGRSGRPSVDERPQFRAGVHRRRRHPAGKVRAAPAGGGGAPAAPVLVARFTTDCESGRVRQRGRHAPGVCPGPGKIPAQLTRRSAVRTASSRLSDDSSRRVAPHRPPAQRLAKGGHTAAVSVSGLYHREPLATGNGQDGTGISIVHPTSELG